MKERVTIVDVARRAGVSVSTVSNYLNGRMNLIKDKTRNRIKQAIEELNYRPNPVARQLKTGSAPFIGLVVPSVANPFYGTFAHHVEVEAAKRGFHVLLGNCCRDPEREREFAEELVAYGVRGIVFGSSLADISYLSDLAKEGLCLVTFDRSLTNSEHVQFDGVGVDNRQGVYIATRHLLGLGHRRIAFVSGSIRTVNRLDRLTGYEQALRDAGVEEDPSLIWQGETVEGFGDFNAIQLGKQAAYQLLTRSERPTGIVTVNDMFALGVYAGAKELGVSIPQDLSVVGFDDIELAEIVEPPLTTVRQPIPLLASKAVELLLNRLEGKEVREGQYYMFPPELIVRRSTAEPKY
ncbi:transcriptional regulator, LacI family [Spirochaeta thermophila DSM 6578]|uniref:Transcriptional regulator, LacI family n=1 Tax=Winmispira thermophila (strain ATCC 700085 / DSM 6578 / Z-1203) TaxID=869211 RepID=G0GBZ9_WINT7|nr:LacI family DNA-binding transcriptional regulator [Spirochaeta thermophila]AEJ62010.1 transcriptional regulator, LacI family [Spirochaeta thermophila DSM 6578]